MGVHAMMWFSQNSAIFVCLCCRCFFSLSLFIFVFMHAPRFALRRSEFDTICHVIPQTDLNNVILSLVELFAHFVIFATYTWCVQHFKLHKLACILNRRLKYYLNIYQLNDIIGYMLAGSLHTNERKELE